jgi:hypothetical protein
MIINARKYGHYLVVIPPYIELVIFLFLLIFNPLSLSTNSASQSRMDILGFLLMYNVDTQTLALEEYLHHLNWIIAVQFSIYQHHHRWKI